MRTLVVEVAHVVVQVARGAIVQEADRRGDEGAPAAGLQDDLRGVGVVLDVGLQLRASRRVHSPVRLRFSLLGKRVRDQR